MIGGIIAGLQRTLNGIIEFIAGVFTKDWERAWNGVADIFGGIFDTIKSVVIGVINSIITIFNTLLGAFESVVNGVINAVNNIKVVNPFTGEDIWSPSINTVSVKRIELIPYASGGFPKTGSMFIANEAGPELVGRIGNQSAVVNNQQIIEGVSSGVYEAVVAAMSQNKNNSRTVIQIDGRTILTATEKASRNRGSNVMGGAFANA